MPRQKNSIPALNLSSINMAEHHEFPGLKAFGRIEVTRQVDEKNEPKERSRESGFVPCPVADQPVTRAIINAIEAYGGPTSTRKRLPSAVVGESGKGKPQSRALSRWTTGGDYPRFTKHPGQRGRVTYSLRDLTAWPCPAQR